MATTARQFYRFGPYRLDAGDRLLYKGHQPVPLPPKVFDTLLLLVVSEGHVLTKDEMMKELWPDTFVEEGTLTQYISLLRKALGDGGQWIENLPRRGYRFTAQVDQVEEPAAAPQAAPASGNGTPAAEASALDERRRNRFRNLAAGLAILVALAAAAAVWLNRRQEIPGPIRSVAVLPFRTVADSPDNYLADGITEALITRLANLKGLRVVSHSRVRQYKGHKGEAAKIGRQLGVEAVIEGTVRLADGQARFSVHGVDTKSGFTIWAIDRFDAKPGRLLEIEGQLAEAAAEKVRGQLTPTERALMVKPRSTSAEAYDLALRARGASPEKAVPMLQRAVELDPEFADAYGWLALTQAYTYRNHQAGTETLRLAISNANLALAKDPDSRIAIRALSHIQHDTARDVEGLVLARRALDRYPDDVDALAAAAESYFRTGLYDRAIPLFEKAIAAEPSSAEFRGQLARMHLFLGHHKEGIEAIAPLPPSKAGVFGMLLYAETDQMEKAARLARAKPGSGQSAFTAYMRGCVLSMAGDHAGARSVWKDAVQESGDRLAKYENLYARSWSGMLFAKLGDREQAVRNAHLSLKPDPKHPVHLFFAAQTYSLLGLKREALDSLRAAVEGGFFNLPMIEYLSRPGMALHAVRDHPEFAAIRADMGKRIDALRARY